MGRSCSCWAWPCNSWRPSERRPGSYTEDDISPAIELNPVDGKLYIIWSRKDGTDYDLYIASFDDGEWNLPQFLTTWSGHDLEPAFIFDSFGRIHILWWQNNPEETILYNKFKPNREGRLRLSRGIR